MGLEHQKIWRNTLLKIAHRGNLEGPSEKENEPSYIENSIILGYDVEIDLWLIGKDMFSGHDKPQYLITEKFLNKHKDRLWIHCKNLEALDYFVNKNQGYRYFWHENDGYTLTSNNIIWTYPNKKVTEQCIIVYLDQELPTSYSDIFGVCGDYVKNW
jgi:hypothetical protein